MNFLDPFLLPSKSASFITKLRRFFYKNLLQESSGTITFFWDEKTQTPLFLQMYVSQGNGKGEWWFPKGIVEESDKKDYEYRAKQETKEEVGLEVDILDKLTSNTYTFYFDPKKLKITKTVHYFVAQSKSQDVSFTRYNTDIEEINDFKEFSWSPIDIAINKTNHMKEKEILMEANDWLGINLSR